MTTPTATACSTPSTAGWPRSPRRSRCCSGSTTSSGPTRPRSLMVQHLARSPRTAALAIVLTYQPAAVSRVDDLSRTLGPAAPLARVRADRAERPRHAVDPVAHLPARPPEPGPALARAAARVERRQPVLPARARAARRRVRPARRWPRRALGGRPRGAGRARLDRRRRPLAAGPAVASTGQAAERRGDRRHRVRRRHARRGARRRRGGGRGPARRRGGVRVHRGGARRRAAYSLPTRPRPASAVPGAAAPATDPAAPPGARHAARRQSTPTRRPSPAT